MMIRSCTVPGEEAVRCIGIGFIGITCICMGVLLLGVLVRMFLIVINIHNLRINLRNEILYSYMIFVYDYVYKRVSPRHNLAIFTKVRILFRTFKNDP